MPHAKGEKATGTDVSYAELLSAGAFALFLLPFGPIFWWTLYISLIFLCRRFWSLEAALIGYLFWFLMFDSNISQSGARRSHSVRKWRCWKYLRGYFNLTTSVAEPLAPGGRYILGYHPHGVVSVGAFIGFGTDAAGFSAICPGLDFRLCTLPANFKIPFIREVMVALGIIDSSRKAIAQQLRKDGTVVVIVVGGAREALEAHPGSSRIHLVTRKGFVREALLAGASLVPCYAFGENEVYDTLAPRGFLTRATRFMQKKGLLAYGYSMPIFWGTFPFTDKQSFGGIQPKRQNIALTLGRPLAIPALTRFEEEGRLEIVFKRRLKKDAELYPFGFDGQAARNGIGMIVKRGTRDLSAAWGVASLERGMLVTTVAGKDVTTMAFGQIEELIDNAGTPLTVTFTDGLVTTWHSQYMEELQRVHDSHALCKESLLIS